MADTKDDIAVYDYIIIGGGTSGAVVARRLAEGAMCYSVCLLEAGPSHEGIENSRMPGGLPAMFQQSALDWGYSTVPQKGCNNRIIPTLRGRFLGGCSAVNGTVMARGAKADYDRIASMGNPGWGWDDMLPHFKASETFHPAEWHQPDLAAHGTNGPLHTEPHPLAPISEKILESFIDCGYAYKPDMFVQGEYEGVGHAVRSIHNGIRSTGADFVHHCNLTNLTVKMGVHVDRIILEKIVPDKRENGEYQAVGVEAHDDANGASIILRARKEIIVSAGTYNSPVILMHSGVGPRGHLTEMNIDCKVNLPGVGENLLDHPLVFTSYQVTDPNLTLDRIFHHSVDTHALSIKEWQDAKTGPMARFIFGCFALARIDKSIQDPIWEAAKSEQHRDDPTGQLPTQPHIEFLNTEMYLGSVDANPPLPSKGEAIFTMITLLFGQRARGTVRLSSSKPTSKPMIDHAFLDNDLDLAVLAEGCRVGHNVLMEGRGTKDIIVGAWPTAPAHPTDLNGWKEHVRANSGSCSHPGGTCKMAPSTDSMGVVDNRLRVRNVQGLRVADVSVLPILNSGHTQAPAYAIGEKVAQMVLQDIGSAN